MASSNFTYKNAKLRKLIEEMPARKGRLLDMMAEHTKNTARLSMYSVTQKPSSPGGPPAVDTGALANSIHWEADGPDARLVMDGVLYGIVMEYGTSNAGVAHDTVIDPRPWMTPAVKKTRDDMLMLVEASRLLKID